MTSLRRLTSFRITKLLLIGIGIICISLLAIQPFTLNQMPETADGILQLYRIVVADHSLKVDNPLWARYSTGIAFGYGAPLFNYFPPLSYYFGSWLHTVGLSFVQSWLMLGVIFNLVGATGMFLLGRLWTQSYTGGWISAVAYIYAPYTLFDGIARGSMPELIALMILPWVFYGFTRLAFYGRRGDFLLAVILFGFFIPIHTLITLHGTLVLSVYCLFLWYLSDGRTKAFIRLLLAGCAGLLITAFFWLPALLETDAIKLNLIADQLGHIDPTRHLQFLGNIFALPHTADMTQMAQPIPITLSIVQLIVSVFGLILAWNDRDKLFRNLLTILGLLVALLVFLNTPASIWIWENVPLMGFIQFPWRLLGLASLFLALATGISVWIIWAIIPIRWIKFAVFSVLTLIIMSYSIPWTYTQYLGDFALNDIRDVYEYERETGQLTISSYSEYLPISVDVDKLDPTALINRFEQSDIIPRLIPTDTLEIISADWTSTSGHLTIQSTEPQTIVFDWLYVDGWQATVNGQTVDVIPSAPVGLVAFEIPSGIIDISIQLQPTPIQSMSVGLSLISLLGIGIAFTFWKRLEGFSNLHLLTQDFNYPAFVIVVSVAIGIFLFKSLVLDHTNSQFKSARFGDLTQNNTEIMPLANFGNQIDLIDAELPENGIFNHIVNFKLYWKLHEGAIETDYSTSVRMLDPSGIVIAESTLFQPGNLATSNWIANRYIEDVIEFELPHFTAPISDAYTFEISVFNPSTLEQLNIMNQDNNPIGVFYELGKLTLPTTNTVMRDRRHDASADFKDAGAIGFGLYVADDLSEQYTVFDSDIAIQIPDSVTAGDEIIIHWIWQHLISGWRNQTPFVRIAWVDPDTNNVEATSNILPLISGYSNRYWAKNEIVYGAHRLIVPATLSAGDYQIVLEFFDNDRSNSSHDVISSSVENLDLYMTVSVPERNFEMPTVETKTVVSWDNGIFLAGYDLNPVEGIQLVWGTFQIIDTNYRLFVHVLDEDNRIVAQWDGVPVDWTRPTTGWVTEEYITTRHTFSLSTGRYRIRVGWYNPVTGENVKVVFNDFLVLDKQLIIE